MEKIIKWIETGIGSFLDSWNKGPEFWLRIGILLFAILIVYFLMKYLSDYNIISKRIYKIKDDLDSQLEIKKKELQRNTNTETYNSGKFLCYIDRLLNMSALNRKIPELTAGLFVILIAFFAVIELIITTNIFGIVAGIIITGLSILAIFVLLTLIGEKRMSILENQLKTFIGLLKNFSASSDDIIQIIERTTKKIKNPIKSYLEEFLYEVKSGTPQDAAFEHLKRKVNHPQFTKIINNISLASKHEANYRRVINLNSKTLTLYLTSEEKKRAIKQNNRMELIFIFLAGNLMMYMLNRMGASINVTGDIVSQLLYGLSNVVLIISLIFTLKK